MSSEGQNIENDGALKPLNSAKRECRHCSEPINLKAKVCPHCNRHQNYFLFYADKFVILVSLVLVILAAMQYWEAHRKNIQADKALKEAKDAKLKVSQLDNIIEESQENLKKLRENIDFMGILLAAENGDWEAYEQLVEWSRKDSNPVSKVALTAVIKIRTYYGGQIRPGHLNIKWKKDVDPFKMSFNELKQEYNNLEPVLHADLVEFIWKRKDIAKKDKMSFFIEVLQTSNSLTAKNDAANYFIKAANESELDWSPFNRVPLFDWWEKNQSSIE